MILNSILIDDQSSANKVLQNFIETYTPEVKVINSYLSPFDALESIKKNKPEIVFSDIDMPDLDGFELLKLSKNQNTLFVFVTGHPEKAIEALRLTAFDFLNKPVSPKELIQCVNRAIDFFESRKTSSSSSENIILNKNDSVVIIPKKDLIYIKAIGQYTEICHQESIFTQYSKPISTFSFLLEDDRFLKPSQSYIINKNQIKNIVKSEKNVSIEFYKNVQVELSKRIFNQIIDFL